jgi:hypothetical protein
MAIEPSRWLVMAQQAVNIRAAFLLLGNKTELFMFFPVQDGRKAELLDPPWHFALKLALFP